MLVGIDTSFSQCRKAQFSQTACLEDKSKEIVRMVVLDKREQNCVSNKLEALGVQKLFDKCFDAKVALAVVSTDECGELVQLIERHSKRQIGTFGVEVEAQNDPFHKIKNSKKARKGRFQDSKIESQKLFTLLKDMKVDGLKDILIQMNIVSHEKPRTRKSWIDLLDPNLRSLDKLLHLVVGVKRIRLTDCNEGQLQKIKTKR